ncbi:hypothetical protein N9C85_01580 [Synechococcus sp. AH-224-I15]|nr:hypothetical protein [Synechococcus sp. AH-224-I15]
MTLKIPRRQFDDNGNPIGEAPDPAEASRYAINYWRNILTAALPNGSPAYAQSMRAKAEAELKLLEGN